MSTVQPPSTHRSKRILRILILVSPIAYGSQHLLAYKIPFYFCAAMDIMFYPGGNYRYGCSQDNPDKGVYTVHIRLIHSNLTIVFLKD